MCDLMEPGSRPVLGLRGLDTGAGRRLQSSLVENHFLWNGHQPSGATASPPVLALPEGAGGRGTSQTPGPPHLSPSGGGGTRPSSPPDACGEVPTEHHRSGLGGGARDQHSCAGASPARDLKQPPAVF